MKIGFSREKGRQIFTYEFDNVKTDFSFQLKDGRNDLVHYSVSVEQK